MARKKFTEVELKIMAQVSENLKRLIKMKGSSQVIIAETTEIPTSTVHDYVNGRTLISMGNLEKIANALNVNRNEIFPPFNDEVSFYKDIPLIGMICAGDGLLAESNIEEYIHYPFKSKRQPDFALRVQGNSMIGAGIENGDIVYMRYEQWADFNGQIVAAIIDDEQDGTLKRMKWTEGSPVIQLIPENDQFDTIEVMPNQVRVCGLYMGHFKPEKEE